MKLLNLLTAFISLNSYKKNSFCNIKMNYDDYIITDYELKMFEKQKIPRLKRNSTISK